MGENEKDSETLDDSTNRTIELTNSSGYNIFSETQPATQGTPQKCLYRLAVLCKNLIMEKKGSLKLPSIFSIDKQKKLFAKIEGNLISVDTVLSNIGGMSRDWWLEKKKNGSNLQIISELIKTAINMYSTNIEKITEMYSHILFKSLSDISQYGALLTNMSEIESKQKKGGENIKGGESIPYETINKLYTSTFIGVSSDKIAAALMTQVARVFDYNYEILSTYKYSGITVHPILIKSEVVAISLIMRKKGSIVDRILNSENLKISKNGLQQIIELREKVLTLIEMYKSYYDIKKMENHIIQLFNLKEQIKKKVSRSDVEKHNNLQIFVYYADLIGRLKDILENNMEVLNLFYGVIQEYEDNKSLGESMHIDCENYLYFIAKSIHNLIYPINTTISPSQKSLMSKYELISACYDNMYGHDFKGLDFIQLLGKKFIELVFKKEEDKKLLLSPSAIKKIESVGDKEKICIQEILNKSKYVSVAFTGEKIGFFINKNTNILTYDYPMLTNKGHGLCDKSYLFKTPFDNKNYFYGIDFYSGEQPYVYAKSTILNILNGYLCKEEILENDINSYMKIYKKQIERLKQKDSVAYEVFTPATRYDGAANYQLYEINILNEYKTSITFGEYKLEIITQGEIIKNEQMKEKIEADYIETHPMHNYYIQYSKEDQLKIYADKRYMNIMKNIDLTNTGYIKTYFTALEMLKRYIEVNDNSILNILNLRNENIVLLTNKRHLGSLEDKIVINKLTDFFGDLMFKSINVLIDESKENSVKEKVYNMLEEVIGSQSKRTALLRTPETESEFSSASSTTSSKDSNKSNNSNKSNKSNNSNKSNKSNKSNSSRGSKSSKGSKRSRDSGSSGSNKTKKIKK